MLVLFPRRGVEARVEDPARLDAASLEAQQHRCHHQVRAALQEVALPEPHGLRAALHDHQEVTCPTYLDASRKRTPNERARPYPACTMYNEVNMTALKLL